MKHCITHFLLVCLALVGLESKSAGAPSPISGTPKTPEVIARLHFVGLKQVSADTNGSVFKEIWNLPATVQLRDNTLNKLADVIAADFQPKSANASTSCSGLIRPLLSDLCSAELSGEVIEHPEAALEATLALRLDEGRRQVWQANWAQLLAGWEYRRGQISILATNSWFVLHCITGAIQSDSGPTSNHSIFRRLQKGQRPVAVSQEYWVKLEADLPRCAEWLSKGGGKDLPRLDLTVNGKKEYLRSEAHLTFREPIAPRVEQWQIPIDTIRDPLISFSAIQGIAPWLKRLSFIQDLGLNTIPNQFYLWGITQTPFQIQAATPVTNTTNLFDRITEKWVSSCNRVLTDYAVGNVRRLPDRPELLWRGLPVIVPYLEPVQAAGQGYLHAGIFPVNPSTNPPPAALFQQLAGRTNLLYYDWEITQARLDQLRPLLQLAALFLTVSPMSTNSTAHKWLDSIGPKLGNTVTEVTVTSPRTLDFVRTSHVGLNGLELLTLANWFNSTNFPGMNFDIWFRPVVKPSKKKEIH